MDHLEDASETGDVRFGFDRRVRMEFHGSKISSDGGLLLFRELDEVLGLHDRIGICISRPPPHHGSIKSSAGSQSSHANNFNVAYMFASRILRRTS